MLNLDLVTDSHQSIHESFDRIAHDLIHNWHLQVCGELYSFTEIEFYYFLHGVHEDNATHGHLYDKGLWRFHPAGLDITFEGSNNKDGGILIRGLKNGAEFINGPRRVLEAIFKSLGKVTSVEKAFGLIPKMPRTTEEISKTTRHGLSNVQSNPFKDYYYRYYIDLDNWSHLSEADKAKIKSKSKACIC